MLRNIKRRRFIQVAGTSAGALLLPGLACMSTQSKQDVPAYLRDHAESYQQDPKKSALLWFRHARFGLFMHYGVYALLGRGEWVMLRERIPVAEYARLRDQFRAENFDADYITDLALAAEMKYINITAKHHDSFCLFRTRETSFNSVDSAAGRDLVAELAEQCNRKGLGLFLYYSLYADWRHPHFYAREAGWDNARPAYDVPEPSYKWRRDEDFKYYLDYARNHLREILTQYGPIAGVWLDPIMGYYHRPDLFPIQEIYELIRSLQAQVLISSKQGANGDEDFAAPERSGHSIAERLQDPQHRLVAENAWQQNKGKHNEICDTLQPRVWGYKSEDAGNHRNPDDVIEMLRNAWQADCNLLLNTGPLPDGSIDATDAATLREVGRRIRAGEV
jgi:alpha-L-fucosidase